MMTGDKFFDEMDIDNNNPKPYGVYIDPITNVKSIKISSIDIISENTLDQTELKYYNDYRNKSKFILFPKTLDGITKRGFITVEQGVYYNKSEKLIWEDVKFIEKENK